MTEKVWLTFDHDTAQFVGKVKKKLEKEGYKVLVSREEPDEKIEECDAIAVV